MPLLSEISHTFTLGGWFQVAVLGGLYSLFFWPMHFGSKQLWPLCFPFFGKQTGLGIKLNGLLASIHPMYEKEGNTACCALDCVPKVTLKIILQSEAGSRCIVFVLSMHFRKNTITFPVHNSFHIIRVSAFKKSIYKENVPFNFFIY